MLVVPNVPCGVESGSYFLSYSSAGIVPNVPCGVESEDREGLKVVVEAMFLMYRLELKVLNSVLKVR